jgi:hypothetical protein
MDNIEKIKKDAYVPLYRYMKVVMLLTRNINYFDQFKNDSNEPVTIDLDQIENEMIKTRVDQDMIFKRVKFQRNLTITILTIFVIITGIILN